MIGFVLFFIPACEDSTEDVSEDFRIENLTVDNYPRVNGSTSTEPLQVLIACKLLGVDYAWVYVSFWYNYPYRLLPTIDKNHEIGRFISDGIRHFGTHGSFVSLIQKDSDLILTARTASKDELHMADSLGVMLIETPIALDAFIFLNNINNPVKHLSTKEIQDIYTGGIVRWSEVGGAETEIHPYMRNSNSGSQELMESLVMKDLEMPDLPDMIIYGMLGLINQLEYDREGLGYSVNYYTHYMIRSDSVKMLSVDGVYPDYNMIRKREYPYTTNVYAVVREDLDKSSKAWQLYELLQSSSGQNVVDESGYIPYY